MFWRRKQIARARAIKLGAAGRTAKLRDVPLRISLAVRFATGRAQLAWFCVAIAGLVALYFVSKVQIEHPDPPAAAPAASPADQLVLMQPVKLDIPIELLYPNQPVGIAPSYGTEALGALALPGAALVVALLLSWQRRKRHLLRHGHEATATIRALDRATETPRVTEVELAYARDGDADARIVTLRSPELIGQEETVLYDGSRANVAIALADLPGVPRLVGGKLVATRIPLLHFAMPVVGIAMIAADAIATIAKLR